jgi:hypothetical protein
MLKVQQEQQEMLLHSDNVLFEREIYTKKTEDILEKNVMEVRAGTVRHIRFLFRAF